MAITSVDGALAGMQPPRNFNKAASQTTVLGKPYSTWLLGGVPGAGSEDSSSSPNGTVLSSSSAMVNGQLPFYNPGSGNTYLARFVGAVGGGGQIWLCDRLWSNSGLSTTSTSAQTMTTPTWPARDETGTTNGVGVLLGVEVSTLTGAGTPTITASYTNSAGVSGRTATNSIATQGASVAGSFFLLGLQAGDVGVQSVQSITLSATWTSGTINLVAYRPIVTLDLPGAYMPNDVDLLTGGMPQLFNGTVLWPVIVTGTAAAQFTYGSLTYTQG